MILGPARKVVGGSEKVAGNKRLRRKLAALLSELFLFSAGDFLHCRSSRISTKFAKIVSRKIEDTFEGQEVTGNSMVATRRSNLAK